MCTHGLPPAYCAVCTRTIQPRPGEHIGTAPHDERRRFGGGYSSNPRTTTFQITKRVQPAEIERSYNPALRAAAQASIQGRFGKLSQTDPNYAAIKRLLHG